jgi:hypothetical protein
LDRFVTRENGASEIGHGEFNRLGRLLQIEAQTFPQQAPAQDKPRAIFGKAELLRPLAVPAIQARFQENQRVERL